MKKLLILTGGGDCPGLNAVIRAVVRSARRSGQWKTWGSIEAFNGIFRDPPEIKRLTRSSVSGIHVRGGTILQTTNRGNPLDYPVQQKDGSWTTRDRTAELAAKIRSMGFDAVINIGGDGSQRISQALFKEGCPIVGVPKTIDNDLSATDLTFGFSTAVQTATESFDRLVTTAASHHRVIIMEVMGRDAGWIALHTAIAGGAELCLIPEIPYRVDKVLKRISKRYRKGKGFVNIVISEGAKQEGGNVVGVKEAGDENIKLGGVANALRRQLENAGCEAQVRTTILGHVQRGGIPVAQDRVLASAMGVKAFELVQQDQFGQMVAFRNNEFVSVSLEEAVRDYKAVHPDHYLINVARNLGIAFGD
ncbi:MAG: ATP-dependent 6-phosphofructokinase [Saprospiraceae bacterium]|nr:ATP-dependent 6-phosphofructokinase [Saprospiraceae bacterium]